MAITNIVLPKSGMGIDEGTVTRWLKSEGDHVERDELLVEVETAKAAVEVVAPVSGVLIKILVPEGVTLPVNSVLGAVEHDDA